MPEVVGSKRYQFLVAQAAQLRRHLLPSQISPTGTYTRLDRVSVHAISYRILCVAEIENYLEDRCVQIAKTALDSWKTHQRYSHPLQHLTVFSGVKFDSLPPYLVAKQKDQKDWDNLVSPNKRIERSVEDYIKFAEEENHGIRERNLINLLIPVGIDLRTLDPTFLSQIDALGGRRGVAAHTSCSMALRVGVDPNTELQDVKKVIDGILDLDGKLDAILTSAT